jgi:transcriptional regulatory protein LevR
VADLVHLADQGGGVLLLVDFASLLSLGELVTGRTGVQVRTVPGVSAPLVVEAVRRAQRPGHLTLEQLAASLAFSRGVEEHSQSDAGRARKPQLTREIQAKEEQDGRDAGFGALHTPRVILSVCLTGFGSAAKIAELIEERLPGLRQQGVEVVCMDINLSGKTEADVQRLVGNRHVVAVVGTINPHLESYPFIALTEFLFGDGVARLRTLLGETLIDPALLQPPAVERETVLTTPQAGMSSSSSTAPAFMQRADLMREISHTLSEHLLFLNPVRAVPLIEHMIELIEVEVGETFELEVLAGLVLHLACIMEQGVQHLGLLVSETVRILVERQFSRELSICRRALQVLSAQMARPLPDEEAYNIVGILRQVDIFAADNSLYAH